MVLFLDLITLTKVINVLLLLRFNSLACPNDYPFAYDQVGYRDHCAKSIVWDLNFEEPPWVNKDDNGTQIPWFDRMAWYDLGDWSVKCPNSLKPCVDAAGNT